MHSPNDATAKGWTPDGFAAWAASQEVSYEFDGTKPQELIGILWAHNKVARNIADALKPALVGTTFDIFGPLDLIHTVDQAMRAPDVFVAPRPAGTKKIRFIPDPIVVIEVVSEDRDLDYKMKLTEYERVTTILRYVVVECDDVGYVTWSRERGDLPFAPSSDPSATPVKLERERPMLIPELGSELPLAAVYAGLGILPY